MNVLCIGNSFSRNSSRYLNAICKDVTVVNLYIGGCPLDLHFRNMYTGNKAYVLQVNGVSTGFCVSLEEALLNREWDYISFQQASHKSVNFDTYEPYLTELSDYVRTLCPKAKQIIHQTWAYEDGSDRLMSLMGYSTHADMYRDIKKAYENAAKSINADLVIPSGEMMSRLVEKGLKVHVDTFHANTLGEYALGLLWYRRLTGNSVADIEFRNTEVPIGESEINIVKAVVDGL